MGFLIWIVAGSTILYILTVDDCEDFFSKAELKSAQKLRYVNPFKGASRKALPVQH